MKEYLDSLLEKHKRGGIVIDTNILLLLVVGAYNPNEITQFKRTQKFIPEDYFTLRKLLKLYATVLTTPNILTEVSNLAGQMKEHLKKDCFKIFNMRR